MADATAVEDQYEDAGQDSATQAEADLALVLSKLSDLRQAFDAKIRYDEVRERHVEALHRELEAHRQGLYRQLLRPVLTDLVGIYDDVAKVVSDGEERGEGGTDEYAATLTQTVVSLRDAIEEALYRNGVKNFSVEGDNVDRVRQRVVEVTETDRPELNRRVARRLRPGFELDDKVLRPEWIVAYKYVPDPGPETPGPGVTAYRVGSADVAPSN
jgi:molecular chaperone GrpE